MINVISIYKFNKFFTASASVGYNLDYGKWLKEYFAKWCDASQQKEENNEENKEADNEENEG